MARARSKAPRISFWNWFGTLLLCSIPGVNLIAIICFLIFSKNPSKRTFCAACLVLGLLAALGFFAVLIFLPERVGQLADWLRQTAARAPAQPALLP